MSTPKKDETAKNSAPVKIVDASSFTKNAHKVATVTDKWEGTAPGDIQEGLQSTDLEQVKIDNLLNRTITIIGFQKRTGTLKGKETEYLIIMAVPEGTTAPVVFITGAQVIRKKLEKCAESGSLPVSGKILLQDGEDFKYYDLVS